MEKLETNSSIAIIGGGPAGSFFALYLQHYATEMGIHPKITIYEDRDFNELGPKGCKGCAGILSASLWKNLDELNLSLPEKIIQAKIEHYSVHSPYASISISNPEPWTPIVSVYRGDGPLHSEYKHHISFDNWLLKQAQKRGVKVENQRVSSISLGQKASIEVNKRSIDYDLVVLATGVNTNPIPIAGLDYVPPKIRIMPANEFYTGTEEVQSHLGNTAHAFLIPHSRMIFGTLVPKGPFIHLSLLNSIKRPVSIPDLLNHELVRSALPGKYQLACSCKTRAVVGFARNYYTDRFVAVGDAVVSRLYKDGIGSALLTSRQAADTVINHGISRQDFKRYYQPFCQAIKRDNNWGRLLFYVNDRVKNSQIFLLAQQRLIGDEQNNRGSSPFTKAAWGMLTGGYSYTNIAGMLFNPISLVKLYVVVIGEALGKLFGRKMTVPRKLFVGGRKVLILGSGFGGTYTLRKLVPSLNRNENVETTMVSNENFFLFSPLLHEVAMGGIETRHVAYPIRRLQWRDRFNFIMATVEKIDLIGHRVITTKGTLDFDYLVLALGSITNRPDSDTAEKKGGNIFALKTLQDSRLIRNHIIGIMEEASIEKDPERQRQLLTFIVSGAGYTGVQVVAELRDFIYKNLLRFYKTVDANNIRIILIEAERKILAEVHTKLAAYALKSLQKMKIEVRLRSRITHIWEDRVEINHTKIVPTRTIIWVANLVANRRIAELDVAKDSIGRVIVNEYMEVPEVPGVYAVGDCAHFEDKNSGRPIPPRAHTGVRQAKIAAHNILAEIRGRDKKPYRYSNPAEMVSLGASKAMFRFHGLRLYGFPARLIWVVAYSLLVTGTYNRIRIIMDWLLSRIFGRDTIFVKLMKQ